MQKHHEDLKKKGKKKQKKKKDMETSYRVGGGGGRPSVSDEKTSQQWTPSGILRRCDLDLIKKKKKT